MKKVVYVLPRDSTRVVPRFLFTKVNQPWLVAQGRLGNKNCNEVSNRKEKAGPVEHAGLPDLNREVDSYKVGTCRN